MKPKNGQSNEVAIKKDAGAVAAINIEQFADTGFDNVEEDLLSIAYENDIPIVATNTSYFNKREDLEIVTPSNLVELSKYCLKKYEDIFPFFS